MEKFDFRGKLPFDYKTIAAMAVVLAWHIIANVVVFDFLNLQIIEYKIIFYINLLLVFIFGVYKDDQPLSFLSDDSVDVKNQAQIRVGFYFTLLCFSLWFFLYEEVVQQMHYNAASGIAVFAFFISLGRLISKGASKYETEEHFMYLTAHFRLQHFIALLYFFGILIGMTIFAHGTWFERWKLIDRI